MNISPDGVRSNAMSVGHIAIPINPAIRGHISAFSPWGPLVVGVDVHHSETPQATLSDGDHINLHMP